MNATVATILRYPVKGLGAETLDGVTLTAGAHLPGDRVWALAHGGSSYDAGAPAWVPRRNFVQTAQTPELARTETSLAADGRVRVAHPLHEPITVDPDDPAGAARLCAWIRDVAGHRQPGPYRVARLRNAALTDVPDAHLSILSDASLEALSQVAGRSVERRRFRGNLWLAGWEPWAEFGLIGRVLRVGSMRLAITERIGRCNATTASPVNGERDLAVLDLLERHFGHTDFGVYARVIEGGTIAPGDAVTVE
jgi:hypothetical protein